MLRETEIPGFVDEIRRSVEETFFGMFGTKVQLSTKELSSEIELSGDVSGVIKVFQEEHECTISIVFPKGTIFGLLSAVYGKPINEMSSSVQQGVGEIANVVYITAKGRLNSRGFKFKFAIPELKADQGHVTVKPASEADVIMPVTTPNGDFNIVFGFTSPEAA